MKTNLKIYTLTGAGTEIDNFNVTDTYEKYIIKGAATSIGNYAITITGTPQAGETFIIKYKGVLDITTNGNTFSILGQSLTQNQLLSDLDIEAYYDGSAWIVEIKPSFTSTIVETSNIVNQALTNAKAATMAAYTVKANNTGSSATPQDVDRCTLVSACAWSLTGNAGTTPGTNFLGTTDAADLVFKVNNIEYARPIDLNNYNTTYATVLSNITSGYTNIAIGEESLSSTTSGFENVSIGKSSMSSNTTGSSNVAIGRQCLENIISGTRNTIIGRSAGFTISTGSRNTVIGSMADVNSASATKRIAIGDEAEADADYQFAIPDDVTHLKFALNTHTNGAILTTDSSGYGVWNVPNINTTAGDSATINAISGRFRKDTSGATFTLTNSFIDANSIILLTMVQLDATATRAVVSATSGSATITFDAAPTSNLDVNFLVIN